MGQAESGHHILTVVGSTGIFDNTSMKYSKKIPAKINVIELQKIVLLYGVRFNSGTTKLQFQESRAGPSTN